MCPGTQSCSYIIAQTEKSKDITWRPKNIQLHPTNPVEGTAQQKIGMQYLEVIVAFYLHLYTHLSPLPCNHI